MEDTGVADRFKVVDVLSQALAIAAGLPMTYRRAHASNLNAASASAGRLTKLAETMGEAADAGAADDWELRRLFRAIRRESRSLNTNLDRAFHKTIRRGPGAVARFDEQAHRIQGLLLTAIERAQDLMLDRAAVSTRKTCVGVDERWHRRLPASMVRGAVRLTPVMHQGRFYEEWMGELREQETWARKFDFAFYLLIQTGSHRRNLAGVNPHRLGVAGIRQDES